MDIAQELIPEIEGAADTGQHAPAVRQPADEMLQAAATGAALHVRDFVTVLTSNGPRLTKRIFIHSNGRLWQHPYENAKYFAFEAKPLDSLEDLKCIIDEISHQSCLILGRVKDGVDSTKARRLLHDHKLDDGTIEPATIEDTAHYWLPIDVDSLAAHDEDGEFKPVADPARSVRCVLRRLPPEFQAADCVWQFTSSAGFKPGIRMRLYFWLSRPLTGAEMKAWLGSCDIVDPSIYVPIQPIYAAPPVIEDVPDPVPQRTGILYLSGRVTPPEAVNVSPPKRAKISGSTVRVNDAAVDGGDHEGRRHTPSGYTVRGPEIVECDEPETISWAIELIQVDLAAHGALEVGKSSDKRTYALVGKLRDGPAWGQSLEPER